MNTKINLYVGLGFDSAGNPIPQQMADEACTLLRDCATRLAGGCTCWRASGSWKPTPNSPTILEPVLVIEVMCEAAIAERIAREIADLAKATLFQSCVAVTYIPVNLQFI